MSKFLRPTLTLVLSIFLLNAASRAQATFGVLHTFTPGGDGLGPTGPLVEDSHGNLFGTTGGGGTYSHGTVYELSRPTTSGAPWTETILYSFNRVSVNDEEGPQAGVIFDNAGNLLGTTFWGGVNNSGTVFELSPSNGSWTEKTLYWFTPQTGIGAGGLYRASDGTLYGTTLWGENAYQLKPPIGSNTSWSEKNLFTFDNSNSSLTGYEPLYEGGALIADKAGNLYGTADFGGAYSGGVVFELSPPTSQNGSWTETVLYNFGATPTDGVGCSGSVIMDAEGNLYGTNIVAGANGFGAVFKLSPPSQKGDPWTETILHSFAGGTDGANPYAGLVMDKSGNLYGVTYSGGNSKCQFNSPGCGTVFELSPNGDGTWRESILRKFNGSVDGQWPYGGLMIDSKGRIFGTTSAGGSGNSGTVFELVP